MATTDDGQHAAMSTHRKPPQRESMKRKATPGQCRWCDKPIVNQKGERIGLKWHQECVEEFKLIHWPAVTRQAVFERDKGICARCGVDAEKWQRGSYETLRLDRWLMNREAKRRFGVWANHWSCAEGQKWLKEQEANQRTFYGFPNGSTWWQHDHIRPLVEADRDERWWHLDNIQTLCTTCHIAKGREDNSRRKAARAQRDRQPALL